MFLFEILISLSIITIISYGVTTNNLTSILFNMCILCAIVVLLCIIALPFIKRKRAKQQQNYNELLSTKDNTNSYKN